MNTARFWKPRPAPYWRDLRAWALLLPAIAATLGAIAYSVQGLATSQGGILPAAWVDYAVRWGAVLLGIGCEGGTLAACIEIARKKRDGDAHLFALWGHQIADDTVGLIVSYTATVTARMLALNPAQSVGAIGLLVLASAADAYFLFNEAGDYLSIRDRNVARWETARWWYEEMRNLPAALHALKHDDAVTVAEDTRQLQAQVAQLQADVREGNREEERLRAQLAQAIAERGALEHKLAEPEPQPAPEVAQLPPATIESWRKVYQSHGSNGAGFVTTAQGLAQTDVTLAQAEEQVLRSWLAAAGLSAQVSAASLRAWRKEAREWCEARQ